MDRNRHVEVTDRETFLPEGEMIYSATDLKGRIEEANEVFARISGYTVEEMVGQPHNMVRHPDMPKEAFEDLWRDLKAGRNWRGVVKNRRKDGGFYWVIANVSPIQRDGRVVGYQSVRTTPTRKEVASVSKAYKRIQAGDQSLRIEHGAVVRNGGVMSAFGSLVAALLGLLEPLARRLTFLQKFVFIFLVSTIPSIAFLFSGLASIKSDIERDHIELSGAKYLAAYGAAGSAIAQHRGASTMTLAGDSAWQAKAKEAEEKADAALVNSKEMAGLTLSSSAMNQLDQINNDWKVLKEGWHSNNIGVNVNKHNQLLAENGNYIYTVAGESGLLLDPEAGTYYQAVLVSSDLPELRATAGLLRSLVAGTAASGGSNDVMLNMADGIANRDLPALTRHVAMNFHLLEVADPTFGKSMQEQWKQVDASIEALTKSLNKEVFDEGKAGGTAESYNDQVKPVLDAIDQLNKSASANLIVAINTRIAAEQRSILIRAVFSLTLLVAGAWLIASFAFDMTRRTERLRSRTEQLACGNFAASEPLPGRDELADIAHSGDLLAERLNRVFNSLNDSVNNLLMSAMSIAAASDQVARSSDEQNTSVEAMASAIEELTVSVNHMSDNANHAHALTTTSGNQARDGGEVIEQVITRISNIAETVHDASNSVDKLGHQVTEISGIVAVIKDIADQTNLLALNAAIEAARAGESGRGFAVVADEVRKLAERTTASTGQISSMIERIRSGTSTVLLSMRSGVDQVQQGVSIAGEAGKAMGQIRDGSSQVIGAAYDMLTSLKEQALTANSVAQNAETIAQMCEETRSSAGSLAMTAEDLKGMANILHKEIRVFRTV